MKNNDLIYGYGVLLSEDKVVSATVERHGSKYSLSVIKKSSMSAGLIESGVIISDDMVEQLLVRQFKDIGYRLGTICVSLPNSVVASFVMSAPSLKKKELRELFTSELEGVQVMETVKRALIRNGKLLQDEYDSAVVQFSSPFKREGSEDRYFVSAISGIVYELYRGLLSTITQGVTRLTSETFSVLELLKGVGIINKDQSVMVVYVSIRGTIFFVVKNYTIIFTHKANLIDSSFVDIFIEQADFIARLSLVYYSYLDRYPVDDTVSKVIFCSDSIDVYSFLKEEENSLKETLNCDVMVFDPTEHIEISESFEKKDVFYSLSAIGAAFQSLAKKRIGFFVKSKDFFSRKDMIFTFFAVLIMSGIIYGSIFSVDLYVNRLSAKKVFLRKELAKATGAQMSIMKKRRDLENQIGLLGGDSVINLKRIEQLDFLADLLPESIWMDSIGIESEDNGFASFALNGNAISNNDINLFISTLREHYSEVALISFNDSKEIVAFKLKCAGRKESEF